jgi:hypothetical protein
MARDKTTRETPEELTPEERVRSTPKTGAEQQDNKRDRTSELPADEITAEKMAERAEAASEVANQTIDEGNEHEVQGKLAVPRTKVMKRGSTKWTDKDGNVVKELNDAEPNVRLADEELPDYLKLHQAVLDGADPLEETLKYQGRKPAEGFAEGKLADAEKHPRTGGIGVAAARPENRQRAAVEKKERE